MIKENHYNIIDLDNTDSTNEYAKRLARENFLYGNVDKTVIIAESQSAGKGRLGRSFLSENGKGIFMSILLRPGPDMSPEQASGLTLVAAVALHEAILNVCGLETGIKWPNDIVADGKKLCGVLTEMSVDGSGVKFVVVGIGLNVSNEMFDKELSKLATSLYLLTGKIYDKDDTEEYDKDADTRKMLVYDVNDPGNKETTLQFPLVGKVNKQNSSTITNFKMEWHELTGLRFFDARPILEENYIKMGKDQLQKVEYIENDDF
jgi:biotin-[acetyl-CoA-carboxylase] ligase BirA-like protein